MLVGKVAMPLWRMNDVYPSFLATRALPPDDTGVERDATGVMIWLRACGLAPMSKRRRWTWGRHVIG